MFCLAVFAQVEHIPNARFVEMDTSYNRNLPPVFRLVQQDIMELHPISLVPSAMFHVHTTLEVPTFSALVAILGTIYNLLPQNATLYALQVTILIPRQTPAYVTIFPLKSVILIRSHLIAETFCLRGTNSTANTRR